MLNVVGLFITVQPAFALFVLCAAMVMAGMLYYTHTRFAQERGKRLSVWFLVLYVAVFVVVIALSLHLAWNFNVVRFELVRSLR